MDECKKMWKKEKILGKGGFATVYLATTSPQQTTLPPLVAVKSVEFSSSRASSDATSLLRESYLLRALNKGCPYIIGCYGDQLSFDEDDTNKACLNLLLEYASLGTLHDRLHHYSSTSGRHGLPESEVQCYTRSILNGLNHIHQHNLVHCDLKPANILLVPSSSHSLGLVPKIADFGLAKFVGESLPHCLRGTPPYMAPESVSRSEYEPPSDVWAIGCVVLELLTGKLPWGCHADDKSFSSLLHQIGYGNALPRLPSKLSREAKDFLEKCFFRDPTLRWSPEMLLCHPFLAMDTVVDQVFKEERGVKRNRSTTEVIRIPSIIVIDSTESDAAAVRSMDYIPLEGGKRRKKMSEQVKEVVDLSSYISIHTTSGSGVFQSLSALIDL